MKLDARFGISILLGAFGGAVFYYFNLPLAWMLGAMTLVGGPRAGAGSLPIRFFRPPEMALMTLHRGADQFCIPATQT